MVTAISTSTSLVALHLDFLFPQSRPDWASRLPPPTTRSVLPKVLPALTDFFV
jgi:hypothetical protein